MVQVSSAATWESMNLPADLLAVLKEAKSIIIPKNKKDLVELSLGTPGADSFEVKYDVPGFGNVVEAQVLRCRNGLAVNYADKYMRRRDPDSMIIADDNPTDKVRFENNFNVPFSQFRADILNWFKGQDLVLLPFYSGGDYLGYASLLVAPRNAAFFASALADIQGMIDEKDLPKNFTPRSYIYLAPPFRHTHCKGRQYVVHNRHNNIHELFSLNLYPGPSAKKGVYGFLLSFGEQEGWVTIHGSTVQVITPYDNQLTIVHEGASGGGKSEMLQYPHREPDGRLLLGENIVTKERRHIPLFQGCSLRPVTDDMAICHPKFQNGSKKLVVADAEKGWFVRVNHITHYGVDSYLENLTINPSTPLTFLNIYAVPKATCLIWEHIEDAPGVPCPNPRVIMPRSVVPGVVNEPVEVDIRSFGVRTPPCTKDHPTYGILGLLHFLPPALAWLWRMVSPRGHANPSITDTEGMSSEGVGSYWPFATGRRVDQANLLLKQIMDTPSTRYTLSCNQHVGAWETGFMPQWIAREYLARRGSSKFKPEQLQPARCPLLGYALYSMQVEGVAIPRDFLQVNTQPEVGDAAYDEGARILTQFFHQELKVYLKEKDLLPLGRKIIECCINGGTVKDYEGLIASS
jgi:hypothetical protein